jgi:hypothetical protein
VSAPLVLIERIFFRYASAMRQAAIRERSRFVHYTSAAAAMSIIKGKSVWLRKATAMNDFLEVTHGKECVEAAYRGPSGLTFQQALNSIHAGITKEFESLFSGWLPFLDDAYLLAISEHEQDEDDLGRLSMWRAYGVGSGVALVLRHEPFTREDDNGINAYTSPVLYGGTSDVALHLKEAADAILANKAFVGQMSREECKQIVFNMFLFAVLSLKHRGFEEEREWRVVHSPRLHPSKILQKRVELVRGVPQVVFAVPLAAEHNGVAIGLSLDSLLDRVIVGPTEYPDVMREAFVQLLHEAGVHDPDKKVHVSQIPLR